MFSEWIMLGFSGERKIYSTSIGGDSLVNKNDYLN
jgi:hypothetical protein